MTSSRAQKVSVVFRYVLAVLFLWAAASKIANPIEFLGSLYGYELPLPDGFMKLVAIGLPWAELMIGLMLLLNQWKEAATVAAVGLLGTFVIFTGQGWLRGLDISCGCFNLSLLGIDSLSPGFVKFVESLGFAFFRNLALTAMGLFILKHLPAHEEAPRFEPGLHRKKPSQRPALSRKPA